MPFTFWLFVFLFGYVYGQTNSTALQTMAYGWDESGKYFASVWDSKVKGSYTAKGDKAGSYSFEWHGVEDAIVAKGFRTGKTDRVLSYDGTFEVQGNGAYLSLYGWSIGSHCVEYYVIDDWGQYAPCGPGAKYIKGTFESDGDLYTFCTTPGGAGCIDKKNKSHVQFISRRHTKRSSGTITFANHVAAWKSAGMILGELDSPQVIAVEAYAGSSGSATIKISEGQRNGTVVNGQNESNGNVVKGQKGSTGTVVNGKKECNATVVNGKKESAGHKTNKYKTNAGKSSDKQKHHKHAKHKKLHRHNNHHHDHHHRKMKNEKKKDHHRKKEKGDERLKSHQCSS